MGVTKDPADALQGTKTRESICIRQTADRACLGHPAIMPNSGYPATGILCRINKASSTAAAPFLPTRNHEEPKFFPEGHPARLQSQACLALANWRVDRNRNARAALLAIKPALAAGGRVAAYWLAKVDAAIAESAG